MTNSWKWIIGLLILLAVAFCAGWIVNGWRLDSKLEGWKKEQAEQAREAETKWNQKIQEANNHAIEREKTIRADADNARNAVDRLRKQLASYTANDTNAASIQRTGTVAELFADCAGKYRDMAETADRLDNDRRKLRDGWPQSGG
ncbi:hypothetical protein [Oxalobacter formigenes]|uniref:hypothetical protein n=1 Tax=Oxalobacter formigenes TaxID=847 RepID=UPI000A2A00E2|nr:hypothetical protein [Oxalobacter formigenes]ARQ46070.1 hypothetical protein BRW83_1327 [Oxalobacter formigenes]MCZ4063699.1 DUF2514 domain-containing protein [Oxalobacter formigenes]QDX33193.1 hypothetical protein FPZ51_06150 [Oxalobacter formigenes]